MNKYFLIDLENVKNSGLEGIEQLTPEDTVVVFYSDKADTLKIDVIQKIHEGKAAVKFIKADNGTLNSLDFQLITYLYYNLAKDENEGQYWIISKDTGYEASIRMAKKLGLTNVHRAPAIINAIHYHQRAEKKNPQQTAEKNGQYVYTDADAPEELPENPDEGTYQIAAEDTPVKEDLVPQKEVQEESSVDEKIHNLLFERCGVDADQTKVDLVEKALVNSENKNQFYQYFRRHMGAKEGSIFYKNIRGQYPALKEIGDQLLQAE